MARDILTQSHIEEKGNNEVNKQLAKKAQKIRSKKLTHVKKVGS